MTSPDLPALIARVRELDARATKGPWREGSAETWHVFCPSTHTEAMGPERVLLRMNDHFPHMADAALIAAYRTAAPLLADECSRLQERVRVLEAALVNISAYLPPGSGSVALQVCDDMRADARAALEGIEVE